MKKEQGDGVGDMATLMNEMDLIVAKPVYFKLSGEVREFV